MRKVGKTLHWMFFTAFLICKLPSTIHSQTISQENPPESATVKAEKLDNATLENVIQYAIKHQPLIQQSIIDQRITENTIKSKLADWYPQINFNYNLQHNFLVQTSVIGGNPVKLGVDNTSAAQFSLTQNIFNRDALLANRSQNDVRLQASQNITNNKIAVAANVSKAFYAVLATRQQISVSEGDITRLERSLKDATNQYKAGATDKIDFKRVTITLNNTMATKKSNEELLKARVQNLKSLMGYPDSEELKIVYDTLQMDREIEVDTMQQVDFRTRIEYQQLVTLKRLREADLKYNKWSYLPNVAINGAYNLNYLNNTFSDLYTKNYPNSFAALTLSLPIFQGGKRKANINNAEWQLKRLEWDVNNLKLNVSSEYQQALATYKSNLAVYSSQKENMELAKEVYDLVQLQYRSGIKTYLEVITSETDLRTARINYYNALYLVLSSKVDVQKALGQLNY
ncbi:Outer membrane protein TolC [Pseudarcicella hirudinis]|uniref:Outer membrane protein TolC n=2 Tax=Pseudarcicella hirudinis TaxID=1079859 RepID=A0A1I5SJ27_9BACT|nr:TolC family protein [Pseudarcicella hirudinis]SFP70725.1 Outer membrane protein TolC [Pseudarcicella hirudinis]